MSLSTFHRFLSRLALLVALMAGASLIAPDVAFADGERSSVSDCKRKKRKKRKKRRRSRRAKRKKAKRSKISAKKIRRWQKRGLSNDEIVQRASGYVVTKRERRKLKRLRVRRSLIAALANPTTTRVSARPAAPRPIDLSETMDPNDIDFDSVPPPDGTPPSTYVKKEPKKKKMNTSLRPSAPFVAKASDTSAEKKPRRVVVSASN